MPNFALGVATILCTVCLHGAINIADDYFDHKKGVDTKESIYKSYVNQTIYTSLMWHKKCFFYLILLSIILGTYIVFHTNLVILVVGVICIITTYVYSGGPFPLANMAFGEFLSFLFFGPVACVGTFYIQKMNVSDVQLLNSVSIGFLVSCLMLANNIRDIETDKKAGKITISVRIGEERSKRLYMIFVCFAYLISLFLCNFKILLCFPFSVIIWRKLSTSNKYNMQLIMEMSAFFIPFYTVILML
jgi:1,4-dihydroxy-2-naphthoate octaprenyltransferase